MISLAALILPNVIEHILKNSCSLIHYEVVADDELAGGFCLSCKSIERIRLVSRLFRDVLGLKSHIRLIFSQACPG